ncbi:MULTISPECIES: hypothetical protein [Acinetobacter]|jgi:hypothetical protein|uniref:Uncharacterized protein n=2 Tax=Acinetobacter TaxID=469 RepID=A0A8H2K1V2_ACIRA|nr:MULTISPECIES: hypothetical protein [Acinetobacter]EXB30456.1 hypothetical protein J546_2963 [Acinetobacter sp. 1461402]EXB69866.1 hypothetical protein J550_2594 [Acinetobacter sp. 230853]KCX36442.1 hypothetical protein J577_2411 [Acinetobacter sp. 263903-1]MDP1443835.1 hypothetical protein [Acinetobacter schindleri]TNX92837.1 hypothetical protein FHY67_04520 [Acinetobacter radioresistens]
MMSYVDYAMAMDLISGKTKQQCNAFTILHYIKNQLLDLFFETDGEFDACECLISDTEDDSSIIARRIFPEHQDYLRLNILEMTDANLFEFITSNGQLKVTLFKKADIGLDYILLPEKLEVKRNLINSETKEAKQLLIEIEPLYSEGANPIHLSSVIALLGIIQNKVFELKDVKFSLDQIEKLQNKPIIEQNPKARGSQIKVADQNWICNFSIALAKEFKDSVPELNKYEVSKLIMKSLASFDVAREVETIEGWISPLFPLNPVGRPPKFDKKD